MLLEQVGGGFDITHIQLTMEAVIPGITAGPFQELAKQARKNYPIAKGLGSVPIDLTASLAYEPIVKTAPTRSWLSRVG